MMHRCTLVLRPRPAAEFRIGAIERNTGMSTTTGERVESTSRGESSSEAMASLEVRDLITEFRGRRGHVRAVNGVSFTVPRGGVLAVIGESGSGKSAMLRSIIGINPPSTLIEGNILLQGKDLLKMSQRDRRRAPGRDISMVFPDPLT